MYKMTETTNMNVKVSKELNNKAKSIAALKGMTLREFISDLIKKEVDKNENNRTDEPKFDPTISI